MNNITIYGNEDDISKDRSIIYQNHDLVLESSSKNQGYLSPEHKAIIDQNPELALNETLKMVYANSSKNQRTPQEEMKKIISDLVKSMKQDERFKHYTPKALKRLVKAQMSTATKQVMLGKGKVEESIVDTSMEVVVDSTNHILNIEI